MPLSVRNAQDLFVRREKPAQMSEVSKTEKLGSIQTRITIVIFSCLNGHFFVNEQFGGILE